MIIHEVNDDGYAVLVTLTDNERKAMDSFHFHLDLGLNIPDAADTVMVCGGYALPDRRFERYMNDEACFTEADIDEPTIDNNDPLEVLA